MSNNEITDLIQSMTELTNEYRGQRTEIAREITRLGGVVDAHIQDIDEVAESFLNQIDHVYVDQNYEGEVTGSITAPYRSVTNAINDHRIGRRRWVVVHLKIGQTHTLESVISVNIAQLRIQAWGAEVSPYDVNSAIEDNQDGLSFEEDCATFKSVDISGDGRSTSGIYAVEPLDLIFNNIVVETPDLSDKNNVGSVTGMFGNRSYFGTSQIIAFRCHFILGTPLARIASAYAALSVSFYTNSWELSRLNSTSSQSNYVIVNNNFKPVEIYLSISNFDFESIEEFYGKFISHRRFTSGDPSVAPINITSNVDFSPLAVPLI